MYRLCAVPKYISVVLRTDEAPSPLSSPHPGVRPPSVEPNFTHQSLPSLYPRLRPGEVPAGEARPLLSPPRLTPSAHVWWGLCRIFAFLSSLCPVPRSFYRRTGAAMAFLLDLRTDSDTGTP
jgi:hypothetical protein